MKNKIIHTPDGFKDFLPQSYAVKLETENRIRDVFHSYGFSDISSPTVEFLEVFIKKDGSGDEHKSGMYKFFNREGDILTLRPDMTPPVARIAATHYTQEELPLRLCYIEKNFRYNESYQGKAGEFTQAGVELIGINTCDASAEVIAIAIDSLLSSGLKDFRIDIGQVGFLQGVLDESGLDEAECRLVIDSILHRDYVAVEEFLRDKSVPDGIRSLLSDLTSLTGDTHIIHKAKTQVNAKRALDALEDLEETYEIICEYGLQDYVLIDLSILGHLDYYTGVIFRGYAYGTGFSILDGGRYDNLSSRYGRYFPSVGFAIKIDDLVSAMLSQGIRSTGKAAETLAAYTLAGRETALSVCARLRKQGVYIENSLLGEDLDKNIDFARRKGMGGVLYFCDDENVRVIDIEKGVDRIVRISELLSGLVVRHVAPDCSPMRHGGGANL